MADERQPFSLYNRATTKGTSIPAAAEEMSFEILAHDQDTFFLEPTNFFKVTGYLEDEISYSSQAQYDNITTPNAPDHMMYRAFKDEAQRSFATYGYLTKKTYSNSSSQSITIKFRAVSHLKMQVCQVLNMWGPSIGQTSTNPKDIAKVLMSLTQNTVGKNAIFNFTSPSQTKIGNAMVSDAKTIIQAAGVATKAVGGAIGMDVNLTSATPQTIKAPLDTAKAVVDAIGIESIMVKNPLCVKLKIGNVFEKDYMVAKSVDVTFSKEFYQPGVPLYGDFTITFESLFNSSNQEDPEKDRIFGSGFTNSTTFSVVVKP